MTVFLGIDPGNNGAIAFVSDKGDLLDVVDMPMEVGERGGKATPRISVHGVLALFEGLTDVHAYLELLTTQPSAPGPNGVRRPMGPRAMATFFRGGGVLETALVVNKIPLIPVPARIWKPAVKCPTNKDAARAKAQQRFPAFASMFDRKKDDGRAEASLIGLYGAMQENKRVKP